MTEHHTNARRAGVLAHLRRNFVGYFALVVAVSMTPLPSQAAAALIGTSDIKNGAVTTKKLAKNAVVSKKIKNESVKTQDLKDGAVTSAKIADGTVSKADIAAAAQGFTSIVTKRVENPGVANGSRATENVACGAGSVAIGGGGYAVPTGIVIIGSTAGVLERSHPSTVGTAPLFFSFAAGDNVAPAAWRTTVLNNTGDPTTTVHYAICASK